MYRKIKGVKGTLICGEGRQTKHLIISWMSVLYRSEHWILVPQNPFRGKPPRKSKQKRGENFMKENKKTKLVKAYFSEEDYERLNYLCSIMKISKSKMIRFLLYYKNIKEAPPVDYTILIREMRAVGNNLNQLARVANAKGTYYSPRMR